MTVANADAVAAVKSDAIARAACRAADQTSVRFRVNAFQTVSEWTRAVGLQPDEIALHENISRLEKERDSVPPVRGNDVSRSGGRAAYRRVGTKRLHAVNGVAPRQRSRHIRADVIALNQMPVSGVQKYPVLPAAGNDVSRSGSSSANRIVVSAEKP